MARARTSTVVKSRYIRAGSSRTMPAGYRGRPGGGSRRQIGAALRYIETRPLGPEERLDDRALFSAQADHVGRRKAREELARLVTPGVAYHSLVLSPGPLGVGLTVEQMRAWTRRVMADLERRWGVDATRPPVTWYAVVHQHTSHIHAHVIVAASRERPDGGRQGTRFGREDFAAMRASGDRWARYERTSADLLREAERYTADLVRLVLVRPQGGGGGRGPTDREEIERSLRTRR
jgi:hypothetical protein